MNNSKQIRVHENDYRGMYITPNKVDTSKALFFIPAFDNSTTAFWRSVLACLGNFVIFLY